MFLKDFVTDIKNLFKNKPCSIQIIDNICEELFKYAENHLLSQKSIKYRKNIFEIISNSYLDSPFDDYINNSLKIVERIIQINTSQNGIHMD